MDRFAALAEPKRRKMIELIAQNGEMGSSDIGEAFDISAPAVSQHLKVLREANLVSVEVRAQQRIYRINSEGMDEIWDWMNRMRQFWNDRFDVLETLLAEQSDSLIVSEKKKNQGERDDEQ